MGEEHWRGLSVCEAIFSRMVNSVNAEKRSGEKKFSVGELWLPWGRAVVEIYGRALGDLLPTRAPKFPYKPPSNSPPKRKPLLKRTPLIPAETPETGVVQPAYRL